MLFLFNKTINYAHMPATSLVTAAGLCFSEFDTKSLSAMLTTVIGSLVWGKPDLFLPLSETETDNKIFT